MGRLISEKDIIKKNIRDYLQATSQDYSQFFEGAPIFVTYYSRDPDASTVDVQLGAVNQSLGSHSPTKYRKIEDFPLYGMSQVTMDMSIDEFGPDATFQGDAVIIPGTVRPLPDDYFFLDYLGDGNLFKVISVTPDRIEGQPFFRIEYQVSRDNVNHIDEQVKGHYVFLHENLGTDKRVVVTREEEILAEYAHSLRKVLTTHYIRSYYDETFNVVNYIYGGRRIYNQILTKFLVDERVFVDERAFLSSLYIQQLLNETPSIRKAYRESLWGAYAMKDPRRFKRENYVESKMTDPSTIFHGYKDGEFYLSIYPEREESECVFPFKGELAERCQNNEKYNDEEHILEDFIIGQFNGEKITEESLDMLNEYEPLPSLKEFLLLPCIIYSLKSFEEKCRC